MRKKAGNWDWSLLEATASPNDLKKYFQCIYLIAPDLSCGMWGVWLWHIGFVVVASGVSCSDMWGLAKS